MTQVYNNIDLSNYKIDFNSIKVSFKDIENKISILKDVNVNDKIGFDASGVLYIDYTSKIQPLIRWFYGQNRENSINKLGLIMEDYRKLLRLITMTFQQVGTDMDKDIFNLHQFTCLIKNFNKSILIGMNNLKNTYMYDDIYKEKIHKMEYILTNFENGF
jgi:hypothetical protein